MSSKRSNVKILQYLKNYITVDGPVFEGAPQRQRIETNIVNVPGNSLTADRYYGPGLTREQLRRKVMSSDAESVINVKIGFNGIEWVQVSNNGDALAQLYHIRRSEFIGELWLTGQNDLN